MISHRDAEFGTKLCNSRPLAALRVRFAQATRRLRRGRISSLRETKCLSHRIAAKVASPAVGTKIAHPLATFATRKLLARGLAAASQFARTLLRLCFAKLLVLLVGGPDDFVAGASRAHPTRPLRGGRITRLERKVVMTTLTACPTGKGRRATTPPRLSSDTCSAEGPTTLSASFCMSCACRCRV